MTGREPTVPGNLRDLQRQIHRLATAPLGPVSITGDQGHIRAYTGTGDTFVIQPSGASFAFQGSLTGLSPHLEANAAKNTEQDGRLTGAEGRLTTAEGRLDGHDTTLASHDTRITTAQARADKGVSDAAAAQSTANSAVSAAAAAQSTANSAVSAAAAAQSRADSAYARAGTGIADAAAAQSRADQAMSAATTASQSAAKIINCINQISGSSGFASGGVGTMATTSDWQQLQACLAS